MASLKDVAKLANVSLMTVSRALNSPERLAGDPGSGPGGYRRDQLRPRPVGEENRGAHATPNTIGVLALDTVTTPFSVEITLPSKRPHERTAGTASWSTCSLTIARTLSSTCCSPIVRTALSTPRWVCVRYRYRPAVNPPLRAGQLRKPARPGGQLYPGRRTGSVYGGAGSAGRRLSPAAVPASAGESSGDRPPPSGAGTPAGKRVLTRIRSLTAIGHGDEHYRDIPAVVLAHIQQRKPQFDSVICGNDRIAFMVYRRCWRAGCAFRRMWRWWVVTTWWGLAICFPVALNGAATAL